MAAVRLVCFHHAGGGPASFHSLGRALLAVGSGAEVVTVVLPGRGPRRTQPRHVDAQSCIEALSDELENILRGPHVLLGHSLGALLAYGLAQRRMSRRERAPEALIVASCRSPHRLAPIYDLDVLDDQQLAAQLAAHSGLPREVLGRPDWLSALMPTLRDDLRMVASFRPPDAPPLPCPLHIVGGYDDPLVPPYALTAWSSLSMRPCPVHFYSGGHFIFRSPDPALVAEIARIAAAAGQPGNESPSRGN